MITGKNFIGKKQSAHGELTFQTVNPTLNLANPTLFVEATLDEINEAVNLAQDAFLAFQHTTGEQRAQLLRTIADKLEQADAELIESYCNESGLPEGRAINEKGRAIFQLRAFAAHVEKDEWTEPTIDTGDANRQPAKPDIRKMMVPIGPVVVFGSSNFPFAFSTAGGDTASALAAGCPVIVKSHPMHAGTGELVTQLILASIEECGLPNGIFSNLNGAGNHIGAELVKHPKIQAVGFTGSLKGGRALMNIAAQRPSPIPVFAEMGSVNPVVLLPEELATNGLDWATQLASSISLGSGQFCTNPGLILAIESDGLNAFLSALSEELEKIDPTCMLHPTIHSNYTKGIQTVNELAVATINETHSSTFTENYANQTICTVSANDFMQYPQLRHEVFGPFSMVVTCADRAELTHVIQSLEGQLTGTIIGTSQELKTNTSIISTLQNRVGRIIFNGLPTGVEVCASMQHGGPYPASSDARFTGVGIDAIKRWGRPFSYQNWPNDLLPDVLKNENKRGILRKVNNVYTVESID